MSSLRDTIPAYLQLRRSLGFKLYFDERQLYEFAAFMDERHAPYITHQLALEWACIRPTLRPASWAARLTIIRCFSRYLISFEPRTQIPLITALPHQTKRARPYLYTDAQIRSVLHAALKLPSSNALWPWTLHCLIGLLVVTGMRVGEACNLELRDVDLRMKILTIKGAKFGKSRLVPLHGSTCKALSAYIQRRTQYWQGRLAIPQLFTGITGKKLWVTDVGRFFRRLSHQVGLRRPGDRVGPRLHDLRHRFATGTLVRWYRAGQEPERRLPLLSAYLGHAHCSDTYWYLNHSPELMREAVRRLEHRWEKHP
jgi:integrase/recombinase XerD